MPFSGREDVCVREAFELIDDLRGLATVDAISRRLCTALAGFGFHAFLMTRLPARTERIDPYILLMSWPQAWLRRYSGQGYYADDPVAQTCFSTLQPFAWSKANWAGCDSERARRVMGEARSYSLNDGVIVPMHDLAGRQASLSMATRLLDLPPSGLKAIHLVSLYAFAAADEVVPSRRSLSPREREILRHTAEGKCTGKVGQALGISQQTVASHLRNIKIKLGGTTVTHTVVLALRQGEINL